MILHSGQTGVERGAHRAARELEIPVAGVCMANSRDELGALPLDVASSLAACSRHGPRSALGATLSLSNAILVIVPIRERLSQAPGMAAIAREARKRGLPCEIADPTTPSDRLVAWLLSNPRTLTQLRLMVTGPRETRWAQGNRTAWQLVTGLITAISPECDEIIPLTRPRPTRIS